MKSINVADQNSDFWYYAIKRMSPFFWYRYHWLNRTQWLCSEAINKLQLKLLQRIVKHSYHTVPYYRDYMDRNRIKPADIQSIEDIKYFPIMTKDQVVEAGKDIVSRRYPGLLVRRTQTGGTTNKPINIYRDIFSIANEHAFVRRQFNWAGIPLRDKCALFLARRIVDPKTKEIDQVWQYFPFMKELIFSNYHLSTQTARTFFDVMMRCNCHYIYSFPSSLNILAEAYKQLKDPVEIRSIMTTAETLDNDTRQFAEETFKCKVFDNYGNSERVCYIFTCEKGHYHIQPEYGLTELVPSLYDTNAYKIVATGFWNYAMPLIRYDIGDTISLTSQPCPCGRFFPVVKNILGREGDLIRTPTGKVLGPAILTYLVRGTNNVLESQIIHDMAGHITIQYVPAAQFTDVDLHNYHLSIQKHLPADLQYHLEKTDIIQRTENGKYRSVISRLKPKVNV